MTSQRKAATPSSAVAARSSSPVRERAAKSIDPPPVATPASLPLEGEDEGRVSGFGDAGGRADRE
jgi:hypothetical protein